MYPLTFQSAFTTLKPSSGLQPQMIGLKRDFASLHFGNANLNVEKSLIQTMTNNPLRPIRLHYDQFDDREIPVVEVLDQTRLDPRNPDRREYQLITSARQMANTIKTMQVRGAPAIGIAAAYGIVASSLLKDYSTTPRRNFYKALRHDLDILAASRPTAVNLKHTITRMRKIINQSQLKGVSPQQLSEKLRIEAAQIYQEEINSCDAIANYGVTLVPTNATMMTICNTGIMTTGGVGTALGVIRKAHELKKLKQVYANLTMPRKQGLLTQLELSLENIPVRVIFDRDAASYMDSMNASRLGVSKTDIIIVGADRIATNGDTANKIGTVGLAMLAKQHDIPFYVAAPSSTFDLGIKTGDEIPIEERPESEVLSAEGLPSERPAWMKTADISIRNPAFDVTPAKYITGFITEQGVYTPNEKGDFDFRKQLNTQSKREHFQNTFWWVLGKVMDKVL